jgi:hypothetical protein
LLFTQLVEKMVNADLGAARNEHARTRSAQVKNYAEGKLE